MVFDPVALLFDILGSIGAGLPFDVVAHDVRQRRAPPRQAFGQIENLSIHSVADDEPLLSVEHGQPTRHIVKSDLEPAVELVDLLFMRASLVGVLFERPKRAGQVGDGQGIGACTGGSSSRARLFALCVRNTFCGMATHDENSPAKAMPTEANLIW